MPRDRTLVATSALLFLASAAVTVWLCAPMSGGMPMPGGWTMSMAWMRMPGQSWPGAALSFTVMWIVMMIAMMIPSLVPSLSAFHRFRFAVALGYFLVWAACGAIAYPIGVAWAIALMRSPSLARVVPIEAGVAVLLAGSVQFSRWKGRQLECCTGVSDANASTETAAFRDGIVLGSRCVLCCAGFLTVLFVAGVMDLRAMAAVTAAITIERLASNPQRVARAFGVLVMAAGGLLIVSSLSFR
ncbi:MAG TPA: DUF2182 domain-containing protein [Thermoanaerobaculia bacterium]|nr:DUF2182 domain-containing protein [Thermoanaerobaculia bacterium]